MKKITNRLALILTKQTRVNEYRYSGKLFTCYGSTLSMFPTNDKYINRFFATCKIWDRNIDLDEIDQKFPH